MAREDLPKMLVQFSQVMWCWSPVELHGCSAPPLVNVSACGLCFACRFLEENATEHSIRLVASLVMEN